MTRPFPRILSTHQYEPTVTSVRITIQGIVQDSDGNRFRDGTRTVDLDGWDVQQAGSGDATFNQAGSLDQDKLYQAFAPVEHWAYVQEKNTLVENLTTGEKYRIADAGNFGTHLRIFMLKSS